MCHYRCDVVEEGQDSILGSVTKTDDYFKQLASSAYSYMRAFYVVLFLPSLSLLLRFHCAVNVNVPIVNSTCNSLESTAGGGNLLEAWR